MNGTATITIKLPVNVALLEYQSQVTLNHWGMSIEDFTPEQLVEAWTRAVSSRLELQAEDTDNFLARYANEEVFLNSLA